MDVDESGQTMEDDLMRMHEREMTEKFQKGRQVDSQRRKGIRPTFHYTSCAGSELTSTGSDKAFM